MNDIVIARYAEDLAWITGIPDEFKVYIHNKGPALTDPAVRARAAAVIDCENTGRESETYLRHIAGCGEPTGEYTVFVQGDPFEHSPDFLALLGAWRQWGDVQPLSWRWKVARDIPATPILQRETGQFIDGLRVRPELFSLMSWSPLGFYDVGTQWLDATYRDIHSLPEGVSIASHFLRLCDLDVLAAAADRHRLGVFSYGAVFGVRQSRLTAVRPDQVERLRQAALGHQVYGYVLERLWLHLFGAEFVLPLTDPASAPVRSGGGFVPLDRTSPRARKLRRIARRVSRALTSR